MATPSLLLTGATGFLGLRLAPGLEDTWSVVRASRTASGPGSIRLDLEDPGSVRRAFDAVRPAAVVHLGAIAGPDACEAEPERARRVNAEAAALIAELCAAAGARLVHFSTDLVFDGERGTYSEDDAPRPISVYGRVKRAAEEAVLARAPGAAVLRVAATYGRLLGGRACFVDELRESLSRGRPIGAFVDQWRSPTAADQLPEVVRALLARRDLAGVFHWVGERTTRFDAAVAFARALGYDERLVLPTRTADKPALAPRPRDSSLDSSRLARALGFAPWNLSEGFARLKAAQGAR